MLILLKAARLGKISQEEKCKINLHFKGLSESQISSNSTVFGRKQLKVKLKVKQLLYSLPVA